MNRLISALAGLSCLLASTTALAVKHIDCDQVRGDDQLALACNIYHEARNESLVGQMAIGHVTRNRVASKKFPRTFREVVYQYYNIKRKNGTFAKVAQFSWTRDGESDLVHNRRAWKRSLQIAALFTLSNKEKKQFCPHEYRAVEATNKMNAILNKEYGLKRAKLVFDGCEASRRIQLVRDYTTAELMGDVTYGAEYYHADYVDPWWAKKFVHTVKIDRHLFYAAYTQ